MFREAVPSGRTAEVTDGLGLSSEADMTCTADGVGGAKPPVMPVMYEMGVREEVQLEVRTVLEFEVEYGWRHQLRVA